MKEMKPPLPLLAYTSSLYPHLDFSNTLVIASQHVLSTTLDACEELFRRGLAPERLYMIGKCYSTHEATYTRMLNRGIRISPLSIAYDSHTSFDTQFTTYIQRFLDTVIQDEDFTHYKKILILDDGGHLLSAAHRMISETSQVVGIEQTSSGYEKIKTLPHRFPILNVARSHAKLNLEADLIAELVSSHVLRYIDNSILHNPRILVIGQGAIGRRIKELLNERYTTFGGDVMNERCDFDGQYRKELSTFDVIIGATGRQILTQQEYDQLKKGVHLISASSSDREFSGVSLRAQTPRELDCHMHTTVNGITLVNGGFPINFHGGEHSLPPHHAQLTRSLLLMALYESLTQQHAPGLIELSSTQHQITQRFQELIAASGSKAIE